MATRLSPIEIDVFRTIVKKTAEKEGGQISFVELLQCARDRMSQVSIQNKLLPKLINEFWIEESYEYYRLFYFVLVAATDSYFFPLFTIF
jgi:hypothetical protein